MDSESDGTQSYERAPAWELYKENAQPLKRGRDTKKLGLSLSTRAIGGKDEDLATKIQEFEELVSAESTANIEDPLVVWIKYINFLRDSYPGSDGSSKSILIMERCTRELCHNPRYQNDDRFIKVWISYADQVISPGDIFKFMHRNKIGAKVALFWVAWAFVSEKAGQDNFTDRLFAKGIQELAMPMELLVTRQKQFQRRLARKYLKQAEEVDDELETTEKSKKSVRNTESVIDENGRKALATVSRKAASGTGPRQQPGSVHPSRSGGLVGLNAPAVTSGASQIDNKACSFSIFKDEGTLDPFSFLNNTASSSFEVMPSLSEKSKENIEKPRAWNDPLVVSSLKAKKAPVSTVSMVKPLEVFVDDAFLQQEDDDGAEEVRGPQPEPKLSMREVLDKPAGKAELLTSNPLSFFEDSKGGSGTNKDTSKKTKENYSKSKTKSKLSTDSSSRYVDPPVGKYDFKCGFTASSVLPRPACERNTNEESEMSFEELRAEAWVKRHSQLKAQRNQPQNATKPAVFSIHNDVPAPQAPQFEIFSDEPVAKPAAFSIHNDVPAPQAPQFEIFSDESVAKPAAFSIHNDVPVPAPQAPQFEIFSDAPVAKPAAFSIHNDVPASQAPQFEIFSDEPVAKPAAFSIHNDGPAPQAPQFEIFSDESVAKPAAFSIHNDVPAQAPQFEIFSDEPVAKPAAFSIHNDVPAPQAPQFEIFSDGAGDIKQSCSQPIPRPQRAKPSEPTITINSLLALEAMGDIFGSDSAYVSEPMNLAPQTPELPSRNMPFAVDEDEVIVCSSHDEIAPVMPCTPPARPQRFGFAICHDHPAPHVGESEEFCAEEVDDRENWTPEKNRRVDQNPDRRDLQEVLSLHGEDAVLRPLPSLAVDVRDQWGDPMQHFEVEDEEGMPLESEIYGHMRGIPSPVPQSFDASGSLDRERELMNLKGLDFAIYCDDEKEVEEKASGYDNSANTRGDNTIELTLDLPPVLENTSLSSPSARRRTADPAFFAAMLEEFRDEEGFQLKEPAP